MTTLEICCPTVASIDAAWAGGADRVEVCCALELDGLTPSAGHVLHALDYKAETGRRWQVNVLIRPRGGDFVYTPAEVKTMVRDIETVRALGADGVVIGALTPAGDVDTDVMRELVEAAEGMDVTFHRAFDRCRDPQQALEHVIALGCRRLLTSGCAPSAWEGRDTIKSLHEQAAGRISIMAGAGLSPDNVLQLIRHTGVAEVHASAQGSLSTIKSINRLIR